MTIQAQTKDPINRFSEKDAARKAFFEKLNAELEYVAIEPCDMDYRMSISRYCELVGISKRVFQYREQRGQNPARAINPNGSKGALITEAVYREENERLRKGFEAAAQRN